MEYNSEADDLTVNKTADDHPDNQQVYTLTLPLSAPEFRRWRELEDPWLVRVRLMEEIYIPWKESSSWWKYKPYKRWRSTPKRRLECNISKVTNCKQKNL